MSAITTMPAVVLDTILIHVAALFLTTVSGDSQAARHAARQALSGYDPQTEEEYRLAAAIISFAMEALAALAQSADPSLSLNQKLRLRSGAVSLSRQSDKAQCRLDTLQAARSAVEPAAIAIPAPHVTHVAAPATQDPAAQAGIDPAALLAMAQKAVAAAGKQGVKRWAQTQKQYSAAKRIAQNLANTAAATGATPLSAA